MTHRLNAAMALGLGCCLFATLPACAQGEDQQIIGPPPSTECCWAAVPDQDGVHGGIQAGGGLASPGQDDAGGSGKGVARGGARD